jgi:type IX secretion system PorP/SprF family membrane protein
MFNSNAAYTGKGDGIKVMLNAQSQNKGVAFANKNFMGGIHSKIADDQALGLRLISDTRGAFQVFKSDITYAYLLKLNDRHKLNFGLNAGILNTNLSTQRIDNFDIIDQSDNLLYNTKFNTLQFTAGFGLLYNFDKLEVSLSIPSLISTNEKVYSYMNAAVFYKFEINEKFSITPWLNYQNVPITSGIGGLFVKGEYMEKIWLQTGIQTNKSFAMMVGVNLGQ